MRVIPPIEITSARLTACNVAEPSANEAEYSGATTYALGDRVISTATHRTYESLVDSNIGQPLTDESKWANVGPTNRFAMFDYYRNTLTTNAEDIELTIVPGQRVDTVALIGLEAMEVEITVTAGVDQIVVYERKINLISRLVDDWYEYFFKPFEMQRDVLLTDLPAFSDAQIHIKIIGTNVAIGSLIVGQSVRIGDIEGSASDDALNFSRIERDDYGNVTLIQRRSVPTTDMRVKVAKEDGPRLRDLRDQLNAKPALWIGIENTNNPYFNMLLRLGIYKRFSFDLVADNQLMADLLIEEM